MAFPHVFQYDFMDCGPTCLSIIATIKGLVKSISSVPEYTSKGLYYTVDVSLPSGLFSTYKQVLPFVQDMNGYAEIVTEDMRLIEQFIRPIRSLLKNR